MKIAGKLVSDRLMSRRVDKIDHNASRLALLEKCIPKTIFYGENNAYSGPHHGRSVNCTGGVGYNDPDLKWLRNKGYVSMIRVPKHSWWSSNLHTTYAVITDEGRQYLQEHRL